MAGPMLKFKNEEKLHISKDPGIKSWGIVIGKNQFTFAIMVCLSFYVSYICVCSGVLRGAKLYDFYTREYV
jgi:hypothetical protein